MNEQTDPSVREFGSTRLALRGDLIFSPQTAGGESYYMVEDPLNSRFFRLGRTEYTLASLLDGRTSIHDALAHLSTVLPHHQLTEHDAAGLCRWLVEMDLAQTAESSRAARLARNADKSEKRRWLARFNPLAFRVPLFVCPDRALAILAAWLGWLYSPAALAGWLVLVAMGAYRVFSAWDRFTASSRGIFAPDNWLWLVACWGTLKVVHELSHGIACKRYGGTVREMGVLFMLFAPLAYVDVTSSWRFRARRQRIVVAAAGMYAELAIAAVAAMVWSETDSGWLNNLCYNAVAMAGFTTLVFNANPLMKFDGYYILSDGLSLPNLYTNGQHYLRYWARRYLLGVPATLPAWPGVRGHFTRVYGWASFLWRIVTCLSLTITAVTLFQGAGVALAVCAVVAWGVLPLLQFAKYFVGAGSGERPCRARFLLITLTLSVFAVALFGFFPWPGTRAAPAVVEYSPHTVIRAQSAGFVREIHVPSGEQVAEGQLLVVLENEQLTRDLADLELQMRQSEIRGRQHEQKGDFAAQQAEAEQCQGLRSQFAEKREQVEQLTIRAPRAGKIVRRDLASLAGVYLDVGDEIGLIGDESQKEIRLTLSQDDLDSFARREGGWVQIDVPRRPLWRSRLEHVLPRATLQPIHPALAAINGGPLPVTRETPAETKATDSPYVLLAPRFTGIIPLDESIGATLSAGQTATVTFRPYDASIGQHLYRSLSRWVRQRLTRAHT